MTSDKSNKIYSMFENYYLEIVLALIVITITAFMIWGIFAHKKLKGLENNVKKSWINVEAVLKKRREFIFDFIKTVKPCMARETKKEEEILKQMSGLKKDTKIKVNKLKTFKEIDSRIIEEKEVSYVLQKMFALSECCLDLKTNENFLNKQEQIMEIEEKIIYARNAYNAAVQIFNVHLKMFPNNIAAVFGSFKKAPFFEFKERSQPIVCDI